MDLKKNLHRWFNGHRGKDGSSLQESHAAVPVAAPAAAAIEPEIVAVIAAVLAIEVKMFSAMQGRSFTFNASGRPQGWSEWGRMLIRPFEGVR